MSASCQLAASRLRSRGADVLALAALTATAALLRVVGLDSGLWYDEIVTLVESVRQPAWRIVSDFPGTNNHPLYSLLAHSSIEAFGEHPWSLRLPALIFGVLSVPLLFVVGDTISRRTEAMWAAALMTVSYHHVWFSQDARGYTALLAWTLLTTWLFWRILHQREAWWGVAYGAVAALGVYTHMTMVFVVVAHGILWAVWAWSRRHEGRWCRDAARAAIPLGAAAMGSLIAYAPLLPQVFRVVQSPPAPTVAFATPGWAAVETLRGLLVGFGGVGLVAAGVLGAAGLYSYWRQSAFLTGVLVSPCVVSIAGVMAAGLPIRPRFFFGLSGFALLLVVRGAAVAGRSIAAAVEYGRSDAYGGVLVGVLVVASLAQLPYGYRYPKQDFDGAVRFLAERRQGDDAIATGGLVSYPLSRYYGVASTRVQTVSDLDALLTSTGRVWLVYSFPEYMDPSLVAAAEKCTLQATLPGTVGGGAVVIRACDTARARP